MKDLANVLKNMSLVSQLGLSLITPLLLMLALCWWLTNDIGLGGWVYIPGFVMGLGSSVTVGYRFYHSVMGKENKRGKKEKTSFNRHF